MANPDFDLRFLPELARGLMWEAHQADVQILGSADIVAAQEAAPFESGLVAVSPLRALLVRYDAEEPRNLDHVHPHAVAVARFLARFLGSEDDEIVAIDVEGPTICLVRELPKRRGDAFVLALGGDEFNNGAMDPRAMHRIVARLRRPDGCPWDRKQTNASLAKNLVDEVYEVVDAIEAGDMPHLAEELGDLYLLILMHAQIAHEAGHFSIEDVYRGIATKIVGRHPHVFGEEFAGDAEDVVGIWQQVKAKEKAGNGETGGKDVDGEPFSMPALTRAARVLKKHPLAVHDETPPLLSEVAAIVARGEDPDAVLREQLRAHVQANP